MLSQDARLRVLVGVESIEVLNRGLTQLLGHLAVGGTAIVPFPQTRDLFEPVKQVHPAQVVEVMLRELNLFACDAVDDRIGFDEPIQYAVERHSIQSAIQVSEALGPVTDQGADRAALLERQRETLKQLGAVDRVEHPRPTDVLRVPLGFQRTENSDQVR